MSRFTKFYDRWFDTITPKRQKDNKNQQRNKHTYLTNFIGKKMWNSLGILIFDGVYLSSFSLPGLGVFPLFLKLYKFYYANVFWYLKLNLMKVKF